MPLSTAFQPFFLLAATTENNEEHKASAGGSPIFTIILIVVLGLVIYAIYCFISPTINHYSQRHRMKQGVSPISDIEGESASADSEDRSVSAIICADFTPLKLVLVILLCLISLFVAIDDGGAVLFLGFVAMIAIVTGVCFAAEKYFASCCHLTIDENGASGRIKTLFTDRQLKLPLDHLDNIFINNSIFDKFRGGWTLAVSSNSGIIRFHHVQNPTAVTNFVNDLLSQKKPSAPAPVPAPAPVQNISGGDAMEKLNSLKQMLENGLITQEEFDSKKADILSKM